MAPLAAHLVGYLSMFLQLGVLALVSVLAVLVRASLGRRRFDPWTLGLIANTLAILVLAADAIGREAGLIRALPAATIVYALLEDLTAVAFIAGARAERGLRPVPLWLVGAVVVAVAGTAVAAFRAGPFLDVYRLHATCFALLLAVALIELIRARPPGVGGRLVVASLAALVIDYGHVPVLTLFGVVFPDNYLGLESYVTLFLEIGLGMGLVVLSTDAARIDLELRNAELGLTQRALHDAAYTDALCAVPNRAAFLESIADPPASGTVAMIDLDGLKAINDRFGHSCGDAALEMAARCLRKRCGDDGTVYRIGGDEFAGIWAATAPEAVEDIMRGTARDLAVLAEDVVTPVRISWGVAAFGGTASFADALIAADDALYERRNTRRD